jgi:hypothetical protein
MRKFIDRTGIRLALVGGKTRLSIRNSRVHLVSRFLVAWAWARPYGTGTAVKLNNKADLDCAALGGEMR